MTWDLLHLIIASGYAGTAGQSFRNHVTGSGAGAKLSDYKITAWDWQNGPDTAPVGGAYSGEQSFSIDISFTQGSRAFNIKRVGSVIVFNPETGNNANGYDAWVVSQSVLSGALDSALTLHIVPPYTTVFGGSIDGTAWYRDYPRPDIPPEGLGTLPVTFTVTLANGAGGSTVENLRFSFTYVPDIGPFNPTLTKQYLNIPFNTRGYELDDFDYEWHANSSYTSLVTTAQSFEYESDPQDTVTYWLRYKRTVDSTWTNAGSVTWTDNRID